MNLGSGQNFVSRKKGTNLRTKYYSIGLSSMTDELDDSSSLVKLAKVAKLAAWMAPELLAEDSVPK